MSKLFEDEAKVLSAIEMSSARGGKFERKLCGCGCGGSQEESDSVWATKSAEENQLSIDMP